MHLWIDAYNIIQSSLLFQAFSKMLYLRDIAEKLDRSNYAAVFVLQHRRRHPYGELLPIPGDYGYPRVFDGIMGL